MINSLRCRQWWQTIHKLRYGSYPEKIGDVRFLNAMDSSVFNTIEYIKLDTGYELNLRMKGYSMTGEERALPLRYPDEFWQGLGCVRSNLRKRN